MAIKWVDNHIEIDKLPKKCKKITGTRLGAILGVNPWSTPFEKWCEITKVYEKPFEDTPQMQAGRVIESKVIDYLKTNYFMDDIVVPEDVYGKDFFKKTFGDFYPEDSIFGGMWDAKRPNKAIIEIKTSNIRNLNKWMIEIPQYYQAQGDLYAYLEGVDEVIFACAFITDEQYEHPDDYVCTPSNTLVRTYKLSEKYDNFEDVLGDVTGWYFQYVKRLRSPDFDEKKDAEILKALRTKTIDTIDETEIAETIWKAETLKKEIDAKTKELNIYLDAIKQYGMSHMSADDENIVITSGNIYDFSVGKSMRNSANTKKMKEDGIYDKYVTQSEVYTLRVKEKKDD